ncbi:hypothetical protein COCCADRAFT_81786 [Bipolaris zeicola 26-R-13]|uniref:Uncharacterized protein n=1 Tax=Cochliobolus carbonum (strain 26-R-13) TaxID=930089 RepID=W6YU00_COCC2|nr:uncharacterized protein COCCADRAFT_81786 [Bipolaris zeicola 26-R-13]EUC38894.1 hypothetical protein COCCADRAFT_81786 [Bipolaris zeicola 26-R-13]
MIIILFLFQSCITCKPKPCSIPQSFSFIEPCYEIADPFMREMIAAAPHE